MNTVTILLATLAIGITATGKAYATTAESTLEDVMTDTVNQYYESTSEPITLSRNAGPQSSHTGGFCVATTFDANPMAPSISSGT